jgi:hypothetical protein
VVVQQPRAIGAPSAEEQLTQVVPSLEPEEDDDEKPAPVAPPSVAPRDRHITANQRTAYGIGLAPPTAEQRRPLPSAPVAPGSAAPSVIVAPNAAMATPNPGIMATRIVHPDVPIGISPATGGTPLQVPPSAMPGFGGPGFGGPPPPTVPVTPSAAFTPANAIQRPVIPGAPASKGFVGPPPAKAGKAPASGGTSVARGCAIAIGVVLTISLGVTLGWLALHFMAP